MEIWQKRDMIDVRRLRNMFVVAAIFFGLILLFNTHAQKYAELPLSVLISDAFLLPGMFFLGFGLLKIGDYYGSFDVLFYGVVKLNSVLRKEADTYEERQKRSQTFTDYRNKRDENRVFPGDWLFVGSCMVAAAALATLI